MFNYHKAGVGERDGLMGRKGEGMSTNTLVPDRTRRRIFHADDSQTPCIFCKSGTQLTVRALAFDGLSILFECSLRGLEMQNC